jgi:hypothetical protein
MEHQRGQRHSTDVSVRIFTRPYTIGIGRVLNVSATGAFLETQLALRPLSLLYLEPMNLASAGEARERIAATVVRCTPSGVGLAWYVFAAQACKAYARLVSRLSDLTDEHQLPLPAMPNALSLPHRDLRPFELPGLCRVEFRD